MNPVTWRPIVWASRWVRNPLVVLILAATTAALCGFFLHPHGFVLAIGLAALVALGVGWPWVNVAGLQGTLTFDRARAREGEAVPVRLLIRNRAPWGAWGLAVDCGLGRGLDAGLARVGGWRRAEIAWEFVPDRRGIFPVEPPRVTSGFPFGLLTAHRRLRTANSVIVCPRTCAVGPVPTVDAGQTADGNAPRNRPGGSGDFLGVRPYRRGDSLRRVHWPQTARSGQMVICELQTHAIPRVQVVLDTDPATHAGTGPDGSLEWAIRVAASFVHGWIGAGAEVDLVLDGGPVAARGGSVAARRAACLDALARLGSTGSATTTLAELLDDAACRRFAGGFRVVVATDQAVARLAARSAGVTERFVVLRADAFDPTVPADPSPAAGSVPPWIWLDDPTRVAAQLRRGWKEVLVAR